MDSWEDVRKDEREAERVPDEIKYRLENIDAESVPAHCKYLSRITNQKGDICFWLKDEYYNDICRCKNYSVCLFLRTFLMKLWTVVKTELFIVLEFSDE